MVVGRLTTELWDVTLYLRTHNDLTTTETTTDLLCCGERTKKYSNVDRRALFCH